MDEAALSINEQCTPMNSFLQLAGGHQAFPITSYSNPPLDADDLTEKEFNDWMEDVILDTLERNVPSEHAITDSIERNKTAANTQSQEHKHRAKTNKIKKRVKTPHVNKVKAKFKDALLAEAQAMDQPLQALEGGAEPSA